jgi:hypothetical protein
LAHNCREELVAHASDDALLRQHEEPPVEKVERRVGKACDKEAAHGESYSGVVARHDAPERHGDEVRHGEAEGQAQQQRQKTERDPRRLRGREAEEAAEGRRRCCTVSAVLAIACRVSGVIIGQQRLAQRVLRSCGGARRTCPPSRSEAGRAHRLAHARVGRHARRAYGRRARQCATSSYGLRGKKRESMTRSLYV